MEYHRDRLAERMRVDLWKHAILDGSTPTHHLLNGAPEEDITAYVKALHEISPSAATRPQGQDRLREIREFNRNNPEAYDADPAMQAEELALISASLPTSQP
jgi:hypothetical protein